VSDSKIEFDEAEQRERDKLLLKLLKTPPEQRPKRPAKSNPETAAPKGAR